jgi:hypothetical protein
MKNIFIFLFSLLVVAQEKEIAIGEFDELKVKDGIQVTLVPSDENKLIISGKHIDDVVVINKGKRLKLRMKTKRILSGFNTTVELFYSGNIEKIEAREGSFISSKDVLLQPLIELEIKEGAEIDLVLDVEKVDASVVTGGILTLKGAATNQDLIISTGATAKTKDLLTEQTSITINAGGNAYINASKVVQATVRAGGIVRVYGKPLQLNKTVFLGGSVIELE